MRVADRAVEIRSPGEGSGLLVGPDLILTAWHVLRPAEGEPFPQRATVRILRDYLRAKQAGPGAPVPERGARVIWPLAAADDDHDFALLQLDDVSGEERADAAVAWADLPEDGVLDVRVIGFPDVGTFVNRVNDPDAPFEERDTVLLAGRVSTGTGLKQRMVYGQGMFDISPRQEDLPAGSHVGWEGVSGAPVFAGDLLVGVTRVAAEDRKHLHRLRALPVSRLFADDAVQATLRAARVVDVPRRGPLPGGGRREAASGSSLLDRFGVARDAPAAFRTGVKSFLDGYVGTSEKPVAFGGRGDALAGLDRWLDDPASPSRLLLHAPGGRGKSALVVHWALQAAPRSRLVFLPISVRSGTNQPRLFFHALAARLAEILHTSVPAPVNVEPVDYYQGRVDELLGQLDGAGKPVLVVIDGLDEAAGWSLSVNLFPPMPHPGLRVLVSARSKEAGAAGAREWLDALGWRGGQLAPAAEEVGPLGAAGVREVLGSVKPPLPSSDLDRVAAQLARLSQGDPLVVQLYAQELVKEESRAQLLRPGALAALKSGLDEFFRHWLGDQKKLWAARQPPLDPAKPYALLAVLACALGPLRYDELAAVCRKREGEDFELLPEAVEAIARFLQADGESAGYVLTHPRLGDYLRDEYFADLQILRRSHEAFLSWGEQTLADGPDRGPASGSRYLVTYLGQHLVQAGAPAQRFMGLVGRPWGEMLYAAEGGYRGFLQDVRRAAHAVEASAASDERRWAWRLRCQVMMSSVASLVARVPPALVFACVEAGCLTARQGLYWLEQRVQPAAGGHDSDRFTDEARLGRALGALARVWPDERDRDEGLRDLLRIAATLGNDWPRSLALTDMAAHLPDALVDDALRAAMTIGMEEYRPALLERLLPRASEMARADALRGVLLEPKALRETSRTTSLLAQSLPHGALETVLGQTRQALAGEVEMLGRVMAVQAAWLPTSSEALLAAAAAMPDEADRARLLNALASSLPEPSLGAALDAALALAAPAHRWTAFAALAPRLSGDLLAAAARHVSAWEAPAERALALGAIAPSFQGEAGRAAIVAQALQAVDEEHAAGSDDRLRWFLLRLAACAVGEDQRAAILSRWLERIEAGVPAPERAFELELYKPHWPVTLQPRVLRLAAAIDNGYSRARILGNLAVDLPPELVRPALDIAVAIEEAHPRSEAIVALAARLPPDLAVVALEAVRPIVGMGDALKALVDRLPPDRLDEAYDLAQRAGADRQRAVLALVAARLPAAALEARARGLIGRLGDIHTHGVLVDLVLAAPPSVARLVLEHLPPTIDKGYGLDDVLVAIAARDPESRDQALALAPRLRNASERAAALAGIAVQLDDASRRDAILAEALRTLGEVTSDHESAETLMLLVPHLASPELMAPFLARVEALSDPSQRAELLDHAADKLPPHLVDRAWAAARAIAAPAARARALVAIAVQFKEPSARARALRETFQGFMWVGDERQLARAMAALVARIADGQAREAAIDHGLAVARSLRDEDERLVALRRFARYRHAVLDEILQSTRNWRWQPTAQAIAEGLDDGERAHLVHVLARMPDERRRAGALAALAKQLPAVRRAEFLELGLQTADPSASADFLTEAASCLEPAQFGRALRITAGLPRGYLRDKARAGLHAHRPRGWLDRLLRRRRLADPLARAQADLARADGLQDYERAHVFAGLPSALPLALASKALQSAARVRSYHWRADVLKVLVPRLPEPCWPEALEMVAGLDASGLRGEAIAGFAGRLPPASRDRALAIVEAIDDASAFAVGITGLAAVLDPPLLQRAIDAASSRLAGGEPRVRALSALGGRLPPGSERDALMAALLATAEAIEEPKDRLQALRHLLPRLAGAPQERAVVGLLQAAGRLPRASLLELVPELVEAVPGYRDPRAALAVYEAVRDAGAWFP